MKRVDLNCDLGESFGNYTCGMDASVIPHISSANVACGFHAGDPLVMSKTVQLAKQYNVAVGAHPGYPDLVGFGRRNMAVSPLELKAMMQYQIGALQAFCKAQGVKLQHVKPHGAMYNMAAKDRKLADAICDAILEIDDSLILLGLSGSEMLKAAKDKGLRYASEVFADRAYEPDGSLTPRALEGSVITDEDEAIKRVLQMVNDGTVVTRSGKIIPIEADSICLHGDGAKAVEFAKRIRQELTDSGVEIVPLAALK
ncbi:MAG: LamB/YcsF family protein [Clostridia bacterium]|nr:LamB/YcsF family protein [Clostridia bacterium]MBR5902906.1 LamB/YcsF family protein [Clostridia bacterium]